MQPTANGHAKSNGKVSPTDAETMEKLGKEDINNTYVKLPEDPVEPTQTAPKKSIFARLFKKDLKGKEGEKKKPEGPKLKTFEIVCFSIVSMNSFL